MMPEIDHTTHAGTGFSNTQEQHITYLFARNKLPFVLCLDLGCGEGYGSLALSVKGSVVAIDFSYPALQTLRGRYNPLPFEALCMDATALGFEKQRFDLVIASHIIEHFEEREREFFLSELVRVMTRDGTAVIATPNHPKGLYYQHDGFHRILYDALSFQQILGRHFGSVEVLGVGSTLALPMLKPFLRFGKKILASTRLLRLKNVQNSIARTSTASTALNFRITDRPENARHLIAVCRAPSADR